MVLDARSDAARWNGRRGGDRGGEGDGRHKIGPRLVHQVLHAARLAFEETRSASVREGHYVVQPQ